MAYQPAWNAGFIWDDDVYVAKNKLLSAPDGLRRIWFSTDAPSQYCPLVYTSFRLERAFWGLDPSGYHLINILLHAANALLVWAVLNRLRIAGAWIAALFFALHPVHVESVAWISERKNVLLLLFYLLALLEWLRHLEANPPQARQAYALSIFFYVLALLSKPTACTFPAALLLTLWLKRQPIGPRRWLEMVPFIAIGLCMGLLTMWWERFHQGTAGKNFAIGWPERILIASRALWFYLGKLLWPVQLTFNYPRWNISPAHPQDCVWPLACVAAAGLIVWLRKWWGRSLETAALFYALTLAPLLGFVMLYTFRYSFVADHYQYVASIGPLALIGAGFALAAVKWPRWNLTLSFAVPSVIAVALGVLTWRQTRIYRDADTLWQVTLARNPGSFMAENNLGTSALRSGDLPAAIEHFRRVIAIQPDYEIGHYNLGDALVRAGKREEALAQFREAVAIDPDYVKAHNNLGNLLALTHHWKEALDHYETAFRLAPGNADTANNLAWLLATCPDGAIRNGERAVKIASIANQQSGGRDPLCLGTLAAAYAEAGRFDDAKSVARTALEWTLIEKNELLAESLRKQAAAYEVGKAWRTQDNQ